MIIFGLNLIQNIADNFPVAAFLNYEQYRTSDQFSKIMENNLEKRELQLPGLAASKNAESQRARFAESGGDHITIKSMSEVYKGLYSKLRASIEAIERLDEMELLYQLLEHYCIVWAVHDSTGKLANGLNL